MSVGGMTANRRVFSSLLPRVDHLRHTFLRDEHAFVRGQPEQGAGLADRSEEHTSELQSH